ncbi:protein PDF [Drosophila tropicalis]|uniref:protein PDF n=1 Tax=Drosophila tropicalis TaxID=46794 RepID=UPI0035ABDD97
MARYGMIFSLLILAICCHWCCCAALAAPDEERYIRKDFNRDLLDWYNNANQYPSGQLASLCRYPYFLDNSLIGPVRMRKRNSELINSLLSLPKNMNDAGK